MREDVIGRANVEDTPQLQAYYNDLEKYDAAALWTVANEIEPWPMLPMRVSSRALCRQPLNAPRFAYRLTLRCAGRAGPGAFGSALMARLAIAVSRPKKAAGAFGPLPGAPDSLGLFFP